MIAHLLAASLFLIFWPIVVAIYVLIPIDNINEMMAATARSVPTLTPNYFITKTM